MIRLALALVLLLAPAAAASPTSLEVEITMNERWEKPQEVVVFPARITNRGPEPTRVAFEIASNPSNLVAPAPPPITIGPGEATDILFTVLTPFHFGRVNEVGTILWRAIPQNGDPQEFELTVGTKGFYVPGPQIFGVMLAIGVAALFFGRKGR